MNLILALSLLSGPPVPSAATLEIRIHVGRNHESEVIRSELSRNDEWFLTRRLRVEANYRLTLVDDLYVQRPYIEIGRGRDRHDLRPGTFSGSGTFLESLASIAAIDQWEREAGDYHTIIPAAPNDMFATIGYDHEADLEHRSRRPVPFPPLPDARPAEAPEEYPEP